MTTPPRRHPNVLNLSEVEPREQTMGAKFGSRFQTLGEAAGGRHLGCTAYEIPPGCTAMPYHFHCANEEAAFILEGEGTVRIGAVSLPIRAGDWISFPVGPDSAHQILNTGNVPLRYLGLSTNLPADVVGYPDSKKVLAWAAPPGAKPGEPTWVQLMFEEKDQVDYFKGEI